MANNNPCTEQNNPERPPFKMTYELQVNMEDRLLQLFSAVIDLDAADGSAFGQAEGDPTSVTAGLPCGDAEGWTPAYDVVPAFLITGMITDRNISCAPYEETLEDTVKNAPRKMIVDFGS